MDGSCGSREPAVVTPARLERSRQRLRCHIELAADDVGFDQRCQGPEALLPRRRWRCLQPGHDLAGNLGRPLRLAGEQPQVRYVDTWIVAAAPAIAVLIFFRRREQQGDALRAIGCGERHVLQQPRLELWNVLSLAAVEAKFAVKGLRMLGSAGTCERQHCAMPECEVLGM